VSATWREREWVDVAGAQTDYCGVCRRVFQDGENLYVGGYRVDAQRNPGVMWIYGLCVPCEARVRADPSLLGVIERAAQDAYPAFLAGLPTAGRA
jgi:hypothetical protein